MQILINEIFKLSKVAEMIDSLNLVELKKGDLFLKVGQVCKKYYFIKSDSVPP